MVSLNRDARDAIDRLVLFFRVAVEGCALVGKRVKGRLSVEARSM